MRWLVSYLAIWHRAQFGPYRPEGSAVEVTCSPPSYGLEVIEGDPERWIETLQGQMQAFRASPVAGQVAVEILELDAVTRLGPDGCNPYYVLLH